MSRSRGRQRGSRAEDELERIRIFTASLEMKGSVAQTGQRITDMMLRGLDLAFLPAGAEPAPENWIHLSPSEALIVIPPPLRQAAKWADKRRLTSVIVEIGQYQVTGEAHLGPDEQVDKRFAERHPFVPLTKASIARVSHTERVDVAIVNLAASVRFEAAE